MTDADIISLYQKREEDAIAETEKAYGSYCYAIAYHILRNESDAKECVNDAYMALWQAIPPAYPEQLKAFLGKTVRNIALNRAKQSTRKKRGGSQREILLSELEECIPAVTSVEQGAEDRVITECIERFLYAQPEEKRLVFLRRYWYADSLREIGKTCRMSVEKVKSMLFRMRKELREYLAKEGVEL
ncbi:MAG: sigma-70 family RNA polymerase sigma factor [Acutalibacter sp.]|nr:sigma-70 family RNA polymerase sigma factor [Acutalibacter sp.]